MDDDDFEDFVRARTTSLLRSAYLLTGDQHLAEDLVQSALARTHGAWRRLRRSGNADAYTRRTMYNLQVNWWRRRRFTETGLDFAPERAHPDGTDEGALRLDLRRALLCLPPRQRAVLVLRYLEDRSEAEAADVLGCTVGTIKSQAAKGLARLRREMPGVLDAQEVNR
ncbi:SigE family RNA polymerase sigma factor [Spongiactinospora gelatinilytica]|uniref:SigE family RNA polymerase sigma factor n=1 Tax=Spongiactinospora gelatinilytica TaxID=2666298 RepID=A0A2W2GPF2_9ACTN|nr:SigE family RNA polymerase sigma factor [Spongiactinospora gelatinilytica]PZG44519.1 SigE family RNA polymerase sigma factor [Spongiactinospora gelatinilytica]